MNENTFLDLGNNNQASQPMGMSPIGGDASFMPPAGDPNTMGDPMMGTDQNAMPPADPTMGGDPMTGNEPVMGANPFDGGEGDADVSGDPEKKAESLAGQLASIFRNDLKNDGINTHEDKKKEVLGMIASAIVDGMNDEDRNSMIEYLSDKLNGSGESDGDEGNDNNQDDGMNSNMNSMDGGNQDMMGGDQNTMPAADQGMGEDPSMQQMMESKVNEVVNEIIGDLMKTDKKKTPSKIDHEGEQGYKSKPYKTKK